MRGLFFVVQIKCVTTGVDRKQAITTMRPYDLYQKHRSASLILFCALILVVVISSSWWRPAITNQLNKWKLLPEPEKLTELYFTQPNSLPNTYIPGQAQKVNFTVHNVEYQTMTYQYKIVEESQSGSQQQTLISGSFKLSENQYKSTSFTSPLTDMGPQAKVVVEIPTVNESIDYLLTRSTQ